MVALDNVLSNMNNVYIVLRRHGSAQVGGSEAHVAGIASDLVRTQLLSDYSNTIQYDSQNTAHCGHLDPQPGWISRSSYTAKGTMF